ncbi:MAG: hypothetical protein HC912_06810 [Saprospiraceae bacterium]|nr:hypothetical protein [Saprospiraceae bacterium]
MEYYERLLQALDPLAMNVQKEENAITAEGYGLYQLLQVEAGIHFIYYNYQTSIPIRLRVARAREVAPSSTKVVRLYDSMDTVTDLRTGYVASTRMNEYESKFLLLTAFNFHQTGI